METSHRFAELTDGWTVQNAPIVALSAVDSWVVGTYTGSVTLTTANGSVKHVHVFSEAECSEHVAGVISTVSVWAKAGMSRLVELVGRRVGVRCTGKAPSPMGEYYTYEIGTLGTFKSDHLGGGEKNDSKA